MTGQADDPNRQVLPNEPLARFLVSRNQYSVEQGRVKANAFVPPDSLRLSVFRTRDLPEGDIWELGRRHVAEPRGKPLRGRAEILARDTDRQLAIEPDDTPPRHATLTGWPTDRSAQRVLAAR